MSTKKWQDGFFLSDNNNFKEIKIRYRGDNPRNWLFEKKNIRIKSKKKSQFGLFSMAIINLFLNNAGITAGKNSSVDARDCAKTIDQ